ncbi:transketolase family protein [Hominifimenecus sp. rT4P-3]|uniref:transketolase family protein n=1 Tax=Hominifimenecus sp. rT4P-3 TaxID=3242979 RepID=UPI003DA5C112
MKMEMNSRNLRFLSRMGSRGAFGQAIYDMAKFGEDFFAVSADLGHASGFDRLIKDFPEKYINVGIAEQNLVGIAAGLAKDGTPVVATTYAPFASMRCTDQVRNYMGYMNLNVKLVGLDSGMIQSGFGGSHYGMEDLSVMRSIPNLLVLAPSDGREIYECVWAMMQHEGPVYLRLTGGAILPMIYRGEHSYQIGKPSVIQTGEEVVILGTGTILEEVQKAGTLLSEAGISCTIIDVHTIKPLDPEFFEQLIGYRLLVTVEEHTIYGGLGGAVAEVLADKMNKPPHLIMGIPDCFPHPGSYEYLLNQCGLTAEKIAWTIQEKYHQVCL